VRIIFMHNFNFDTVFTVDAVVPAFTAKGKPLPESSLVFEWTDVQNDPANPAFTFEVDPDKAGDNSIIKVTISSEPDDPNVVLPLAGTLQLAISNKSGKLLGNGSEGIAASAEAESIGEVTFKFSTDSTV
jgi:hypothetical protein